MDNHETQAKLGTQDTEQQRQYWAHKTQNNTGNIGHTRHRTTKTIMRHRQYWAHKTQNNKDNHETQAILGSQDTEQQRQS